MLLVKGKVIVGAFYEKELQKRNQKGFRMEKVIKRKDDKLYVKATIVLLRVRMINKT